MEQESYTFDQSKELELSNSISIKLYKMCCGIIASTMSLIVGGFIYSTF